MSYSKLDEEFVWKKITCKGGKIKNKNFIMEKKLLIENVFEINLILFPFYKIILFFIL